MERWMDRDRKAGRGLLHKWVPGFNSAGKTEHVRDVPFTGNIFSTSLAPGGYSLITGTGTTMSTANPAATGAEGVLDFVGDASTLAHSGIREGFEALPADCFGNGREFAYVARMRSVSDAPVVTNRDYALQFGLSGYDAGNESADGIYWYHDKDTSYWTLKAARSSTRSAQASTQAWSTSWVWLGFRVMADASKVIPYVNGVALTPITTNIQPNDGIQSYVRMARLGASTVDLNFRVDHIAWGWAEAA